VSTSPELTERPERPRWFARVPRKVVGLLALGAVAVGLAACGGGDGDGAAPGGFAWDSRSMQTAVESAPFVPVVTNSPNGLGVGANRIALALQSRDGSLVGNADVSVRIYRLAESPEDAPNVAELVQELALTQRVLDLNEEHQHTHSTRLDGASSITAIALDAPRPATERQPAHEGDLITVYAAVVDFDSSGWWGFVVDVTVDGESYSLPTRRYVLPQTPNPRVGDAAIASEQRTARDVDGDLEQVSSAMVPTPELLDQTIAEALESGRPSVIAFVTPAFCQTRFCGPVLEVVVMPVFAEYGDRVNFLHVEPFDLDRLRNEGVYEPVPAVRDWGLETEPFIYVVDADGIVVAALEGITDEAELREAVEVALAR